MYQKLRQIVLKVNSFPFVRIDHIHGSVRGRALHEDDIIPEFNDFVYRGKWNQALEILLSTNNFPEFTGRVCPAPCEAACVAGLITDPVTIRHIELAIVEKGFERGLINTDAPASRFEKSVAVVGSGPAGLAAADSLNKAGYRVTVFDDALHPGGILRYGIPDFKLEKWVVKRRIRLMKEQGVIFETGIRHHKQRSRPCSVIYRILNI